MFQQTSLKAKKLLFVVAILLCIPAFSQKFQPTIGFHGGINFTMPTVTEEYQIISFLNPDDELEMEYDPFYRNFGNQIGFSAFMGLNNFLSIGLMPQLAQYSYGHTRMLEFTDYQGTVITQTENASEIRLNYINIPLIVKYTLRDADFSPYLIGGASYGILRTAQHSVSIETIIQTGQGELRSVVPLTDGNSTEFITSKFNLLGGIGASYNFTQFELGLDISYWYGLNNIINETNRFSNQTISGNTYDVPGDTKLNHLVVNLSVLFPINKVSDRGSLDCIPFKQRR